MTPVRFQAHPTVPHWLFAVSGHQSYIPQTLVKCKKHGEYISTNLMVQLQTDFWQQFCKEDVNQWRKSLKQTYKYRNGGRERDRDIQRECVSWAFFIE